MPHSLDQILPSLESLGMLAYWIIGLAAALEAWFVTSVFVPGTLAVDAGGILVEQGALHFFDLAWFVAIGSVIGTELGFWTGRLARRGLTGRWKFEESRIYRRAEALFARHGGMALVIGRFLGPVAGLVPVAAAFAGMERRRFLAWNVAAAIPYALFHILLGYFLGDLMTRFGPMLTRIALFALAVLAMLALLWWLVIRIERLLPFAVSVGRSVIQAVGQNPDVAAWAARHPGLSRQIGRRFDPSRFEGLPATFLGLVFVYIFTIWLGSVFDFLRSDPIMQADERVANLAHAFWTPGVLRIAAHVTALGDWRVVLPVMVAALGWLAVKARFDLALGLIVSVAGDLASVSVLKMIFHRPRPALAYFAETTNAFPSGHAAISVAFWGMLFYVAWRMKKLGLIAATMAATAVAFMIGLSRIYLIEHYMTDVLNGWLVGALWVIVAVAVAEVRHGRYPVRGLHLAVERRSTPWLWLPGLALVAVAGWNTATYEKALNIVAISTPDQQVASIAALVTDPHMSATTESVMGTPLEPINVILLAPDSDTLVAVMQDAGWLKALQPGPVSLGRAAWAAWTNREDPTAPVTPYFWSGNPNDLAFEKPTPAATLRKRHHVRIWRTPFVLPDGQRVFVGAASFDDGLDPGIFHHIDPNIDAERDTLAADLGRTGKVRMLPSVAMSKPRLGESVAGDPWFTDGAAAVISVQ